MKVRRVYMRLLAELSKSGQIPKSRGLRVLNGPVDTKSGTKSNNVIGELSAAETELEGVWTACSPRNRKASAGSTKVNIPHSARAQPSEDDLPGVVPENVVLPASLDLNGRRNTQAVLGTGS